MRLGKNLYFSKNKSVVKGNHNKSGSRTKAERGVEQGEAELKINLVGFPEKKPHVAQIERKTLVLTPALSFIQESKILLVVENFNIALKKAV